MHVHLEAMHVHLEAMHVHLEAMRVHLEGILSAGPSDGSTTRAHLDRISLRRISLSTHAVAGCELVRWLAGWRIWGRCVMWVLQMCLWNGSTSGFDVNAHVCMNGCVMERVRRQVSTVCGGSAF